MAQGEPVGATTLGDLTIGALERLFNALPRGPTTTARRRRRFGALWKVAGDPRQNRARKTCQIRSYQLFLLSAA
jgi:hypothetical protein